MRHFNILVMLTVFGLAWILCEIWLSRNRKYSLTRNKVLIKLSSINEALLILNKTKTRNAALENIFAKLMTSQLDKQSAKKVVIMLEKNLPRVATEPAYRIITEDAKVSDDENTDYDAEVGIDGDKSRGAFNHSIVLEPRLEYELALRHIERDITETMYNLSSELSEVIDRNTTNNLSNSINKVLARCKEKKLGILNDINNLRMLDGYNRWREEEAKKLAEMVQHHIQRLQSPENCERARKLVCYLNRDCDFSCQLHYLVYCFVVSYATYRTLILKSEGWRYNSYGWNKVFLPISPNCVYVSPFDRIVKWPGRHYSQVMAPPTIAPSGEYQPYLPLSPPPHLAKRLNRFHGNPTAWWVGQFLKYLLRPQPSMRDFLISGIRNLSWQHPIVGVFIQNSNLGGGLVEYMTYVEDYYRMLEGNGTQQVRRIFLASDDAQVINGARSLYPHYQIIGDPEVANGMWSSTNAALNTIILDIYLLSISDHLVCAFSSHICRLAYELMQTLHTDASQRFMSVDQTYHFNISDIKTPTWTNRKKT